MALPDILAAVPYDPQLAVAVAGRDPYAWEERRVAQRSIFLGQLALGMRTADAARAAGVSTQQISSWSERDPYFGKAYQAVVRYTKEFAAPARTKLSPQRVARLFEMLRTGNYSVAKAAAEIGLTEGAICARRRRDKGFSDLMLEAQSAGQAARDSANNDGSAATA
ncbi:hypothetical protein [Streptomyces sp. NPDC057428]|uniref:hypothetical protein n=1 Tax=Streptomyces sp. NPDC057428 TaxID=3346129 RepID=UPI0036A59BE6